MTTVANFLYQMAEGLRASNWPRCDAGVRSSSLGSLFKRRTGHDGHIIRPHEPNQIAICYVEHVNRPAIIAAIDAEIERLQQARFLIAHSAVGKRSSDRKQKQSPPTRPGQEQPIARTRKAIALSRGAQPTVIREKPVLVTRIAPKEPPKRRIQAATKHLSALTSDVPQGPIAVPATRRETTAEAGNRTATPTSAFGLAITRGLAAAKA
jgi:hypothetical protein